jgi:hypothetical protein
MFAEEPSFSLHYSLFVKINLYLTTSRVNINGANINIFIDDHFPLIISEVKVHGNFSDLNNILKDSLIRINR